MKKYARQNPDSPADPSPLKQQCLLDEARILFDKLTGEAARRAEADRHIIRRRGPIAKLLLVLTLAAVLFSSATMIYGVYKFPDAPIRQTTDGYEGKGGRARTQKDFEAFIMWEKIILFIFPSTFGFGFAFAALDTMQHRKNKR